MHAAAPTRAQPIPLERALRPFATWPVLSVTALVVAVHLVFSVGGEYWIDEVYTLAAGKYHPAWGYADQPPLVPLLAAGMDWLAPGSKLALRLPATAATAGAVVIAALVARELGGDRRAQVLTAAAQATGMWTALVGHWLTPYTVEPLLWLTLSWVLVRWLRTRDDRLLLVLGALIGVTAQTKFQIFVLGAAVLASTLLFGPRHLLRRPLFWAGAGLAVLIALPNLLWQAMHGWPQIQMAGEVAAESPLLSGGRSGTAWSMVLFAGVAGGFLLLYGLFLLLFCTEWRSYRFLAVTFVSLYVLFVAAAARPYYLAGLYGVITAVGALGLQRRREAKRARSARTWGWVAWPAYALSVPVAAFMLLSSTTLTSEFGLPPGAELAHSTAAAYRSLPAQTRQHTAVLGDSYIVAAYLEVYRHDSGLPQPYSPQRGYGYFSPPPERDRAVLYVGGSPGQLRPYFTEVRKLPAETGPVWLCTGQRMSWTLLWPRLRHL